jgi:hypothetical protein
MSIKPKAVQLVILAVVGGLSVACGSQPGSSDVFSAGEPGNSPATTPTTTGTSPTGWFEPAGTYELAMESKEGYRLEGIVHVGEPTRISEAPKPDPNVSFEDCGMVNQKPTEASLAFPVFWKFTNATEADGFSLLAVVGVEPESGRRGNNGPTSFADYEDGSLACRLGGGGRYFFGGAYDISTGRTVTEEGFVFYHDYFSPNNPEGAVEEVQPRLQVRTRPRDGEDWRIVEFTGPGVYFEEQKAKDENPRDRVSGVTLFLPIGRTPQNLYDYENTYTNGYTESARPERTQPDSKGSR